MSHFDKKISELLAPRDLTILNYHRTIADAFSFMHTEHISSVIVVDDFKNPIGIYTEKDALISIAHDLPKETLLSEVMSKNIFSVKDTMSLYDAYILMAYKGYRHIVVTDAEGECCNILSEGDFIRHVAMSCDSEAMIVEVIMDKTPLILSSSNLTIKTIAKSMTQAKTDYAVITKNLKPIGIVTEREIATYVAKSNANLDTPVTEIMTNKIIYCDKSIRLKEAADILSKHGVHDLIVLDEKKNIIGVLTRSNIIKASYGSHLDFLIRKIYYKESDYEGLSEKKHNFSEKSNFLELLINTVPDPIWVKDLSGIYLLYNTAFAQQFNIDKSEDKIKMDGTFFDIETVKCFNENDREIAAADTESKTEMAISLKNNTKKGIFEILGTKLRDPEGGTIGILYIAHDITERKSKESELSRLNIDLENVQKMAKLGSWSYNIHSKTFSLSKEALNLLGFDNNHQVTTEKLLSMVDAKDLAYLDEKIKESQGNRSSFELVLGASIDSSEKYFHIKCEFAGNEDEGWLNAFGVIHDVTELTLANNRLMRLNNELLIKNRMAQMGEMIGIIAHQWKKPLNSMSSLICSLQAQKEIDGQYSDPSKELDYIVENFSTKIGHLSTTLDDFRYFSNPGKKVLKTDIAATIQWVIDFISDDIVHGGMEVVLSDKNATNHVILNKNEFIHVLLNLFRNAKDAFKTQSTKQKIVHIGTHEDDNYVYVDVIDNAGGISDGIQQYIFQRFFTTKTDSEGTGIGLYLCKTIVEDHFNGTITFENIQTEYGYGSKFTFSILKVQD